MGTTFDAWAATPPCDLAKVDEAQRDAALHFAQALLWAKTGRRFGVAHTTGEQYRPVGEAVCGAPWTPELHNGEWSNRRGNTCCRLLLEHQPVREIVEVRVDGAVLAASSYTLEGAYLLRVGGHWPYAAACDAAPVEVDYDWGADLPTGADVALGELACEFVAAMRGDTCRLPSRVRSIARQGVTIEFDPATFFHDLGLLGLPLVDAFISTVNPHRQVSRSRVLSPDVGRRVG